MSQFYSSQVRFDDNIHYFEYDAFDSRSLLLCDRAREEPRHLGNLRRMASVQDLLESICCRQGTTVVLGNLSRYPDLVSFNLDLIFGNDQEIAIRIGGKRVEDGPIFERDEEMWWSNLIQDYRADDGLSACDVLFWIEPDFDALVERPPRARQIVVLTSHLLLAGLSEALVVAHHVGGCGMQQPLAKYVETPKETTTFVPDLFFGKHIETLSDWGTSVCADVRGCNNSRDAFLKLLNARDAIRYSAGITSLKYWTVAIDQRVLTDLLYRLQEMKSVLAGMRIPCNLSGVNLITDEYINSFLV